MDVVKSSNLDPDGERYVPLDLVYDTPYGLGYELGDSILDRLSDADEPATELEMVIEDFQALHLGFQRLLSDFSYLKRSRSVMTKPEPNEDAPAIAWEEYEESLRYRMP